MLNIGVNVHVVAEKHGGLAFSEGRADPCEPHDAPFMTGFLKEFSQRCGLRTFTRVNPSFGKTPLPLMGT